MREENTDFEVYLERYCRSYHLTREEALEHEVVKLVKHYYEAKDL